MRVGNSIDFHPFIENKPLVLGGVTIDYPYGLEAISDGDVVLHSIAEAILGALALGDLGTYFKEKDSKGIDSKLILQKVFLMMKNLSYKIGNIDVMVLLEEPKLSSYINKMRETISAILETNIQNVSIKATTMEQKGIIGKKEGCLSMCTLLLEEE